MSVTLKIKKKKKIQSRFFFCDTPYPRKLGSGPMEVGGVIIVRRVDERAGGREKHVTGTSSFRVRIPIALFQNTDSALLFLQKQ